MGEIKIVVLDRGWVMVGEFRREGDEIVLVNYANVRSWSGGGLPGVAQDPSLAVLDRAAPDAEWRCPWLCAVGGIHDVDQEAWRAALQG